VENILGKTLEEGEVIKKLINFVKENKSEVLILLGILLIASFFRLYRISDYMTYLGDEGRDVIVVRRLLVYFDPILIGPGTSIGNMYLGPLYYYLIAPSLWLAGYSPVGPSVLVALVGVFTVFLVWKFGRELSGKVAGLIAAFFYAISPTVIIFSRSSWNPNVMPFFSLLSIYSVWKVYESRGASREVGWWLIVLGISYAFCLQSHYLGLLLLPTFGVFLFIKYLKLKKEKLLKPFVKNSLISLILFLFLMSPLVIFDARHGWRNFAAMKKFFAVRQETVSIRPWNAIPKIYPIFEKVNIRLLAGKNVFAGKTITFVFVIFLLWLLFNRKKLTINRQPLAIILVWLAFALIGLGLYKQEIYDHYYGFFFPAPFLLMGALAERLANKQSLPLRGSGKRIVKILLFIGLFALVVVNLVNSPLKYPPNQQLRRAKEVAQKVAEEAKDKEFNFAVIAERNYESGYRYFLEMWKKPVVDIDAQKPDTITNQLFVVCEMEKAKCDPTHNPKAEVANFGWSKIDKEITVFGTTMYKLVHTD
jgi:4-amino-4-deoxy-L-arabinose transferase-like glycosyltransferase